VGWATTVAVNAAEASTVKAQLASVLEANLDIVPLLFILAQEVALGGLRGAVVKDHEVPMRAHFFTR